MSTREQHQLDEHFRRVLASAEVEPPPAVWQAVLHARRGGKGRLGLWGRFLALMLLPILGSLLLLRWAGAQQDGTLPAQAGEAHVPMAMVPATMVSTASLEQDTHTSTGPAGAMAALRTDQKESGSGVNEPAAAEGSMNGGTMVRDLPNGPKAEVGTLRTAANSNTKAGTRPAGGDPTAATATMVAPSPFLGPGPSELSEERTLPWLPPGFMRTLPASLQTGLPFAPLHQAPIPLYGPSKGEWLIGLELGSFHVRHRWQGNDAELARALDATEPWRSSMSPALRLGRRWYSGWSVFTGLAMERTSSAFAHIDRNITRTQEIQTWFVTLNNTVFISDIDTIVQITVEEEQTRGTIGRSVWRIPVEGQWQRDLGRWHLGVRAGLCLEFTKVSGGHTLVRDDAQGTIRASMDADGLLDRRHPPALLGMVGLEAGYLLHERWSLRAGPVWMEGLGGLGGDGQAHALPGRRGFTFGIMHHFNTRRP